MNAAVSRCPDCGKPMAGAGLLGICPACLLKAGLDTALENAVRCVPSPPPPPDEVGRLFPRLQVLELLGQGGMGVVYKARQKQLDRLVALKLLRPKAGRDSAFAARFEREAKALAKLHHPNIVTLYEFGEVNGEYYLLMEYVDGVNLRQMLRAGHIPTRAALGIVSQICDALQAAHDRGIIHCDVKPENILLTRDGRVKIADFGLAKIMGGDPSEANEVRRHEFLGTPEYMAPEQTLASRGIDQRTDIYALGVVFYQLLTGELPGEKFELPSKKAFIDVRLDKIVLKALEENAENRYTRASLLKAQVYGVLGGQPSGSSKPKRFTVAAWVGGGILVASLAVFAAIRSFSNQRERSVPAPPIAETANVIEPLSNKVDEHPRAAEDRAPNVSSGGTVGGNIDTTVSKSEADKAADQQYIITLDRIDGFDPSQEAFFRRIFETRMSLVSWEIAEKNLKEGKIRTVLRSDFRINRYIRASSVFLVRAPFDAVSKFYDQWDPSMASGTDVVVHREIANPLQPDFADIGRIPGQPMKELVALMVALPKRLDILNLTAQEVASFPPGNPGDGEVPSNVREFWIRTLTQRCRSFKLYGIENAPSYEAGGSAIRPVDEIKGMGQDSANDFKYFVPPEAVGKIRGSRQFWRQVNYDGLGVFVLGASCSDRPNRGEFRMVEIQYYASAKYYASVVLTQIWPAKSDDKSAAIVRRIDLVSTPAMERLKGADREAGEAAMRRRVEQTLEAFQRQAESAGNSPDR